MDHWNVFDANCQVGRHLRLQEGGLHTPEHLLEDMDHYGVAEALVLDSMGRENHPADGNARVLQVTAGNPRLHPVWTALPPGAPDEQPPPAEFLRQMRAHGVAALTLLPRQYRFELSDWCIDALLEPLAEARVPVFINYTEIGPGAGGWQDGTDWNAVVDLCRRHPTLPVIVSEYRIRRTQRLAYRALEACPNLHIELSAWWLHRGIEYITERWGSHRLLFGSNWPTSGHHMTLATLTTADISADAKRAIARRRVRALRPHRRPACRDDLP
jgi:predicted TIM-barrel fold metal-dependent hydrolase